MECDHQSLSKFKDGQFHNTVSLVMIHFHILIPKAEANTFAFVICTYFKAINKSRTELESYPALTAVINAKPLG